MDSEKLPFYLRQLTNTIESKIADRSKARDAEDASDERSTMYSMQGMNQGFMEPDWDDIDKKANLIVARYTVISTAANVLPFGADLIGVAFSFTKMTTELAGVYQVIISNKRARQMGWGMATTTGTVLGVTYAASKLASFIPGGYFFGVLFQAPIVGAVAWAAGDTLKGYFKETRRGREPGMDALRDSFAKTLHVKLKAVKTVKASPNGAATVTGVAAASPVAPPAAASENLVDKIAGLHELFRAGALTQSEYDKAKADILKKM